MAGVDHDTLAGWLTRLQLTAIRDQLDNLLDEAAERKLTLRESLAMLVEREGVSQGRTPHRDGVQDLVRRFGCAGRGSATSPTGSASSRTTAASSILAVCAVEWETFLADAVVETHDRIVGRTYREAARTCESQLGDETVAVREALRAFAALGRALIGARDTGEALDALIADGPGWEGLGDLVARADALANTAASDPLDHVLGATAGSGATRRACWTPRRRPWPGPCWKPWTAAQRRHGAADRLPAAELEAEPAAARPIRSPPLGDGGSGS